MDSITKQIERFVLEEKTEGKGRVGIFCPYSVGRQTVIFQTVSVHISAILSTSQ
jgi:hypothetical protein